MLRGKFLKDHYRPLSLLLSHFIAETSEQVSLPEAGSTGTVLISTWAGCTLAQNSFLYHHQKSSKREPNVASHIETHCCTGVWSQTMQRLARRQCQTSWRYCSARCRILEAASCIVSVYKLHFVSMSQKEKGDGAYDQLPESLSAQAPSTSLPSDTSSRYISLSFKAKMGPMLWLRGS